MKTKLFLGVAAAATTLAGVTLTSEVLDKKTTAVPFLNPLLIAQAQCGEKTDGLAQRRAFFVRAAQAYANATGEREPSVAMLRPNLGAISYDITTAKPEARAWFNQGLAFTYNFNHAEAINAFHQAQKIDPECAMCFWGEAFALGPNINAPMVDDAVAPAWKAINAALALRNNASEKEQALINALSYRYEAQPNPDRSKLDNAFADAMDDVANEYSDDDFIEALSAEANMYTQAWDYWTNAGRTPKGRTARTLSSGRRACA